MAGAVGLAATIGSGTAFAGTSAKVQSYSILITGTAVVHAEGNFQHDGEQISICDERSDGDRAVMQIGYSDSTGDYVKMIQATGGLGDCTTYNWSAPEGESIWINVWHQNGSDGAKEDLTRGSAVA
jgi:hypothetical protein